MLLSLLLYEETEPESSSTGPHSWISVLCTDPLQYSDPLKQEVSHLALSPLGVCPWGEGNPYDLHFSVSLNVFWPRISLDVLLVRQSTPISWIFHLQYLQEAEPSDIKRQLMSQSSRCQAPNVSASVVREEEKVQRKWRLPQPYHSEIAIA